MTSHEMRQADPLEHDRLMRAGARAGRACLDGGPQKWWAGAFGVHPSRASRHLSPDYPDGPQTQVLRTFHSLTPRPGDPHSPRTNPFPLLMAAKVQIEMTWLRRESDDQLHEKLAELAGQIEENDYRERKAMRESEQTGRYRDLEGWSTRGASLRAHRSAVLSELARRAGES